MKECLWLIKNGIPFDVAFDLDPILRAGWCILFSEMEGAKFNWHRLAFEDDK